MGQILAGISKLVDVLSKKPWTIFIVFTLMFGIGYYNQNEELKEINFEVGGLRAEMGKMNEIIKLKVQLAEKECT